MSDAAVGVSCLEAKHAWSKLDLTLLATLNDLSSDPCFKLIEAPGFFSTPDMEDNRHDVTGAFGEELVTSFARGKSFEYHGAVLGSTRDKCLTGKSALLDAFGPDIANGSVVVERRMVITPSSTLVDASDPAPTGYPHTFTGVCRKVTVDDVAPRRITDEGLPPIKWALRFTLEMRITDGLYYQWDPSGHVESDPKYA